MSLFKIACRRGGYWRAWKPALALFAGSALAWAESGTMPSPPAGVVETGAPAFVVLGPESMGLSAPPTDLRILPDGRILAVSQREIAFSDGVRWEVFRAAEGQKPIVSQVIVDGDGLIYTGIEGGIARVDLNADARWQLTPVVDLPRPDFERSTPVSVVATAGEWYWFGGGGGVVKWRPGQTPLGTLNVPSFDRIFSIDKKVYLRDVALGHISEWDPLESTCRHASLSIL